MTYARLVSIWSDDTTLYPSGGLPYIDGPAIKYRSFVCNANPVPIFETSKTIGGCVSSAACLPRSLTPRLRRTITVAALDLDRGPTIPKTTTVTCGHRNTPNG